MPQLNQLKIVFAGTPEIARSVLATLLQSHLVELVLTQPDKPSGRGKKVSYGVVKQLALEHGIEVLQPLKLKDNQQLLAKIASIKPDIMIVVAYGMILPAQVLNLPRLGCVNIHVSLLPRWRGAAPIQRAIIAGDAITGVTIMQMDSGMDTGGILLQESIAIASNDTSGVIHDKLAILSGSLILDYLANYKQIKPSPQPTTGVSYANKIDKSEALINWHELAEVIERKIRGFNPFPGMYTRLNGEIVKIWQAKLSNSTSNSQAGTIIDISNGVVSVTCGQKTVLHLCELQLAGKNRQLAQQFINGKPDLIHKVLV